MKLSSIRFLVSTMAKTTAEKKTVTEIQKEKSERIMEGVGAWAAFYRENPQRFAADFLNVKLKILQKILLYMMMHMVHFMYFASRGSGKTWLTALYCGIRCILYPGTKICIASGTKGQAMEVISKIKDDFMKNYGWGSLNLCNEIEYISDSPNTGKCDFYNGSYIHIVTANDNARHNRANIIIIDEFRMVDKNTLTTVLKKFLTTPRSPGYLADPMYAHLQERNSEIYMSSAWYSSHWCYEKAIAFLQNMLSDKRKYFVCGLPYQHAIMSGLLMREEVEDEMSEDDFDPIGWSMEMECLFYGQNSDAFFFYDDFNNRRKIKNAYLPLFMYEKRGFHIPEPSAHERRILSVDVALMASRKHKNDASSIQLNVALPNDKRYQSNYVYFANFEGLTTDELGITIMRYFYHYKCTDMVLDTVGNGLGVYDFIIKDQYDPETGETYGALTSCNNPEMAERCKVKDAKKVVWCIKADTKFNSQAAYDLRAALKNGAINLLIDNHDAEEVVRKIPSYSNLSEREQTEIMMPYVQTSMLINEAINLDYELVDNKVKLTEHSGMRKDRVSALLYNNAVVQILNTELNSKKSNQKQILEKMFIRRGKIR